MRGWERYWSLERTLLLLLLVFSGTMLILSPGYGEAARRAPQWAGGIIFLLTGYLSVVHLRQIRTGGGPSPPPVADEPADSGPAPVAVPWPVTAGYSLFLLGATYGLGLGAGTWCFFAVFSRRVGLGWAWAIAGGLIMALVVRFGFGTLLQVPMPEGLLIDLF